MSGFYWLLCITFLFSTSLSAQETLRSGDVLSSIERYHPQLKLNLLNVSASEGSQMRSRGAFDPTLDLKGKIRRGYYDTLVVEGELSQRLPFSQARVYAGYRIGRPDDLEGPFPTYDSGQTLRDGEWRIGAEISLLKGLLVDADRASMRIADQELFASQAHYQLAVLELRLDALDAYWRWFSDWHKRDIKKRLVELALKRLEQMRAEADSGGVAALQILDVERMLAERRGDLAEAELKLAKSSLKLAYFYRDTNGQPLQPKGGAPEVLKQKVSKPVSDAQVACHPLVQASHAALGAQKIREELAENQLLPKLDVGVQLSRDIGDIGPKPLRGTTVMGTLAFSWPSLMREARGKARAATFKRQALEEKVRLVEDKTSLMLQTMIKEVQWLQAKVEQAQLFVDTAEKVESAEQTRFRFGDSNLIRLNIRENNSAKSRSELVEAYANFQRRAEQWQILRAAVSVCR